MSGRFCIFMLWRRQQKRFRVQMYVRKHTILVKRLMDLEKKDHIAAVDSLSAAKNNLACQSSDILRQTFNQIYMLYHATVIFSMNVIAF